MHDPVRDKTHSFAPEAAPHSLAAARRATRKLAEPLTPEDCAIQSMADASPTKWHLAHFETFILAAGDRLAARSIPPSLSSSTRTTTRWASGIRVPSAGSCRGPRWKR